MAPDNWFENWFDTPYYHLLYTMRDDNEAAQFVDALVNFLNPKSDAHFLDLACGKGRHSIYLNKKGFNVTGLDLSTNSINTAKQFESSTLKFMEHDMRNELVDMHFDFVLNLFTSFGYFANPKDDIKVIQNVKHSLKPNGIFVLDYFNVNKTNLVIETEYTKILEGIRFDIEKKIENCRIIKRIHVCDKEKKYDFSEQVTIYNLDQFKQLLGNQGLTLVHTFGNYNLDAFDEATSDRLILVAKN